MTKTLARLIGGCALALIVAELPAAAQDQREMFVRGLGGVNFGSETGAVVGGGVGVGVARYVQIYGEFGYITTILPSGATEELEALFNEFEIPFSNLEVSAPSLYGLFGGPSGCESDTEYDDYGRISASWEGLGNRSARLKDWLDPQNTGAVVLDGKNFTGAPDNGGDDDDGGGGCGPITRSGPRGGDPAGGLGVLLLCVSVALALAAAGRRRPLAASSSPAQTRSRRA